MIKRLELLPVKKTQQLPTTVASEGTVLTLCLLATLLLGLFSGPLLDLLKPLF